MSYNVSSTVTLSCSLTITPEKAALLRHAGVKVEGMDIDLPIREFWWYGMGSGYMGTRRRAEKIAWAESGRDRTVTVERISRRHGKRMITCSWVYRPPKIIETVVAVRHSCDEGLRLVPHA